VRILQFFAIAFVFFAFPVFSHAQGGPPMVTDDPGTVADGHWEINIATLWASDATQAFIQFPYFDVNYGVGDRLQLKVETGWVTLSRGSEPARDGAGTLLVGAKYRFLDEDRAGIAVSMYPAVQFHPVFSSKDPDLNAAGNQYILPLEFLKAFGNWEVNPEIGYIYETAASDEFFYGFVLAYEKLKPWEPLFEVRTNTHLDGSGSQSLLNFGFRYTFNARVNLIGAAGHTVSHFDGVDTEFDGYLGLQLEL